MSSLIQEIEQGRREMISLGGTYELTSKRVIDASKKLDQLLNRYQKQASAHL